MKQTRKQQHLYLLTGPAASYSHVKYNKCTCTTVKCQFKKVNWNKRDVIVCAHSRRTEPQTNKQTNILRVKSCINNPRPPIPSVLDTACVTASSVQLSYSTEGVTTTTVTGDNKQFVFGDNNLSHVVISQSHLPHQHARV